VAGTWGGAVAAPQADTRPFTGQVESIMIDQCGPELGACAGSLVLAQGRGQEVTLAIPAGTTNARVAGQSLSVALAGAIFASFGGATAARILADQAQRGTLVVGERRALQLTFLSSFRAALLACTASATIGIDAALIRGRERSPAARHKHENVP